MIVNIAENYLLIISFISILIYILFKVEKLNKELKNTQEHLVAIENGINPKFEKNAKLSTIYIIAPDGHPTGVAFFVSKNIVITAHHNLVNYITKESRKAIRAQCITCPILKSEEEISLKLLKFDLDFDYAILYTTFNSSYFLPIPEKAIDYETSHRKSIALLTFGVSMEKMTESLFSKGVNISTAIFQKYSDNHVAYICSTFSGDSGAAIVLSLSGELIAFHVEVFNEGEVATDDDSVKGSLNNLIKGLAQACIGLRLDTDAMRNVIKKSIEKYE
jgi:hypothetical protein